MKLNDNWRQIVKKAWSIRLMVLAGLLSAAEIVLPLFMYDMPRSVFAALSAIAVAGAFVSRLIVQKDMT
jgi:hypothetical protein